MKVDYLMNRRALVKALSVAGGLAAARPLSANDKISVGFIGTGVMGAENMKAAMAIPAVQVTAVCDVYQPNLEQAAAQARRGGHQPKEFRDFREMLKDRSIDAVCISTPDHWHPYMAVEACKTGKDVYVEKPVCVAVNEGTVMVQAARKYNRIVQAGTWQRSAAHFQRAREIVQSGALGKVSFCRTWIYQNMAKEGIGAPVDSKPPAGLDWDLWLGPAAERPFNSNRFGVYPNKYSYFRYFWDYAGGHLTDSGVHMIDALQMIFDEAMPAGVTAMGGRYWVDDNSETPDTMQVAFQYPSFLGSWEHRCGNLGNFKSRQMGLQIHGDQATLYVDRAGLELTPEKGAAVAPESMTRQTPPHPAQWANFIECVHSRKRPNSEIETCFRSSASCILGNLAYRYETRLDWDDARKTIKQSHLRQHLDRPYRAPWKLAL